MNLVNNPKYLDVFVNDFVKQIILYFFRGDEGVANVVPNFDWICPREKVEEEVSS